MQNAANVTQVLTTSNARNAKVMDTMAEGFTLWAAGCKPQEPGNTSQASAKLAVNSYKPSDAVLLQALSTVRAPRPQNFVNLGWACVSLQHEGGMVVECIPKET